MSMINNGNNLAAYTANEVLTSLKRKFSVTQQITVVKSTTRYVGVVMPIAADGVIAAFNQRIISPKDGDLEIGVNRDCEFTATTAWDEIPGYQGSDPAKTKFYDLDVTAPTGGVFEEIDTVKAAGSGSNRVAGAFPDTGFRVYEQGKKACLRLVNPSTSDDVIVTITYSWVEVRAN